MRAITVLLIAPIFALAPALAFAGADNSGVAQTPYPYSRAQPSLTETQLAQSGHDQICNNNYTVCMNGCGGATSCSNQCKANLDGCLAQGR